jgi:CelD/BcsL family acetyltransferase involved in cellulose biosynthesis
LNGRVGLPPLAVGGSDRHHGARIEKLKPACWGVSINMSVVESTVRTRVQIVDPIVDRRWAELVERAPDAGVFHHPLWLALLHDSYRYPMMAVCLQDAGGELVAGLPIATVRSRLTGTRLVSVPFSDTCRPILGVPDHEDELLAAVEAERQRVGLRLEVHADVPRLPGGCASERFYHHVVPLDGGPATVRKRMAQSKRTGASRARRQGVSATQRVDADALDAFFRLHVLTRHKLGLPTQPHRFFRNLLRLFDRGHGFVLLVEWEGRAIGAGVFLRHGATLTYKYGASDPAHLDKRPNNLMMMEALLMAEASGCGAVDLGRTEDDNDGLRRFKRDLGADERPLTYTMAPAPATPKSVRSVSTRQQALIRRMPPAFGQLLGAAVYRHFG